MYFGSFLGDKSRLLSWIFIGALWTTTALCGLWFRKSWCRFALSLLIVLSTVASMTLILREDLHPPIRISFIIVLLAPVINGAAIWALNTSPDIQRLTSRLHP